MQTVSLDVETAAQSLLNVSAAITMPDRTRMRSRIQRFLNTTYHRANKIERELYKQASSASEYNDKQTFEQRVKPIAGPPEFACKEPPCYPTGRNCYIVENKHAYMLALYSREFHKKLHCRISGEAMCFVYQDRYVIIAPSLIRLRLYIPTWSMSDGRRGIFVSWELCQDQDWINRYERGLWVCHCSTFANDYRSNTGPCGAKRIF